MPNLRNGMLCKSILLALCSSQGNAVYFGFGYSIWCVFGSCEPPSRPRETPQIGSQPSRRVSGPGSPARLLARRGMTTGTGSGEGLAVSPEIPRVVVEESESDADAISHEESPARLLARRGMPPGARSDEQRVVSPESTRDNLEQAKIKADAAEAKLQEELAKLAAIVTKRKN